MAAVKTLDAQSQTLSAETGTVFYNLNLFSQWEDQQRRQGFVPAREIEKALRWNGDPSCSGKGAEFVDAFIEGRSQEKSEHIEAAVMIKEAR